jgi:glyoxylase-like metal-dependent hydrolase (beta-lactamase superfamily II)
MQLTRRRLLQLSGGAAAALSAPRLLAQVQMGSGTLTTVSDGHLVLPGEFVFGPVPADELGAVLANFDDVSREQVEPECNLTLWRDGTNTVLFDAGAGPNFMPTAGELIGNLDAAGLAPEDVTHVVFTHAHPDHIWGVLDDFGDPLFPDANLMMGREEWDYWWDPATVDEIGEARAAFAVGAKRRMEAIEDRVEFFGDGDEILPGIAAVASFGHTPGHMAFELRSGSESALVVGDAIGNHHVAFARPEWPSGTDQDTDRGIETRLRLLDRLASEDMRFVGFHLPDGGMGRVERHGDAYRFVRGSD